MNDGWETTIEVSADKPGRTITVEVAEGGTPEGEPAGQNVTLSIDPRGGTDSWTWLDPDEARKLAKALVEAAARVEQFGEG